MSVNTLVQSLKNTCENFTAVNIAFSFPEWEKVTNDKRILDIIKGVRLEFCAPVIQNSFPHPISFSGKDKVAIDQEVIKMRDKGIIIPAHHQQGEFISNIFATSKKDGSCRVIINLKNLNPCISNHHFKMDSIKQALELVNPGCFFTSADLKDAYYSVSLHPKYRKFCRFIWGGTLYEFTCLPQGLCTAPRFFTKIMKILLMELRKQGIQIVGYLDDTIIIANSKQQCETYTQKTIKFFDQMGLTIHPVKSKLAPVQKIEFLGFEIDSVRMTVKLTAEKSLKISRVAQKLLNKREIRIRKFAQFIGQLVAAEQGVSYAALHYKQLEVEKTTVLKRHKGDYDKKMTLSSLAKSHISWWVDNVKSSVRPINPQNYNRTISSDSSGFGWGAHCEGKYAGGPWSNHELRLHINEKELMAAFLALKTFSKDIKNGHILLEVDNSTAVSYISKQGGRIRKLNLITNDIWDTAIVNGNWITCKFVPGTENVEADKASRNKFKFDKEWMLDTTIFRKLSFLWGPFDIDLFASRINRQLTNYISCQPDPEALSVDAFSSDWSEFKNCYCFCPFRLVGKVTSQVRRQKVRCVLIAPIWPSQTWFISVLQLCVDHPRILQSHKLLHLPQAPNLIHPLEHKIRLAAFKLSGKACEIEAYQKQLPVSWPIPGDEIQNASTHAISKDGLTFVVNNRQIQCIHL